MKIAIDSGPTTSGHSVRGVGVYTRELINALDKIKSKHNDLQIYYKDFEKEDLSRYDVIHKTTFSPFYANRCLGGKNKIVLSVHDLIPLIYPKQYPPGTRGRIKFELNKLQILKNVSLIVTMSETSKKDIVRFFGINPEKVRVVYEAAGMNARVINNRENLKKVAQRYKLPSKFILYVGDVNYNKNIPTLIKGCSDAGMPLVIAGKHALVVQEDGQGLDTLKGPRDWARYLFGKAHPEQVHFEALKKLFTEGKVRILGYVPDEDIIPIYNLATIYVQPSLYEGFGLPVLEAMACGIPVVISKTNALVELAGGAASVFDPYDYKDLSKKIVKLISDSSQRVNLIRKGLNRAKEFTWEKTAQEMVQIYRLVGASN